MDHVFLLRAAVCILVAVGLLLGTAFFAFAHFYAQSIRGKDVGNKIRAVKRVILVLFVVFIMIFVIVRCSLTP
jgi:uncharacterized membrane-anchored protein